MHGDNTTAEVWKPIEENPDYEVSNQGRVRSLKHGKVRVLALQRGTGGYPQVQLSGGSRSWTRTVHGLVAKAFLGPRPDGYQCCHNDGDCTNNAADNLRWGTHEENCLDAVRHGTVTRGERHARALLTRDQVLRIRQDSRAARVISEEYGVSRKAISDVKCRRSWAHVPEEVTPV